MKIWLPEIQPCWTQTLTSYLDLLIFSHYYLITFYLKYLELYGRIMNSSKIDGFSVIFLDILEASLLVVFFSGHSNALHLFQIRKTCGNVTKLYCSIHPLQTQEGVTLKGQHYYLLFFSSALKIKFLFSVTFPSYKLPSSLEKKQIKLSWQYKKK